MGGLGRADGLEQSLECVGLSGRGFGWSDPAGDCSLPNVQTQYPRSNHFPA